MPALLGQYFAVRFAEGSRAGIVEDEEVLAFHALEFFAEAHHQKTFLHALLYLDAQLIQQPDVLLQGLGIGLVECEPDHLLVFAQVLPDIGFGEGGLAHASHTPHEGNGHARIQQAGGFF